MLRSQLYLVFIRVRLAPYSDDLNGRRERYAFGTVCEKTLRGYFATLPLNRITVLQILLDFSSQYVRLKDRPVDYLLQKTTGNSSRIPHNPVIRCEIQVRYLTSIKYRFLVY